jgi:hypothetical protein
MRGFVLECVEPPEADSPVFGGIRNFVAAVAVGVGIENGFGKRYPVSRSPA